MRLCLSTLALLFFVLAFFSDAACGKEVPATPTGGGGGGQVCQQFAVSMVFESGVKIFKLQVQAKVGSIPIKSIMSAEFNCGQFQVMCYATIMASDFNACVDQAGSKYIRFNNHTERYS